MSDPIDEMLVRDIILEGPLAVLSELQLAHNLSTPEQNFLDATEKVKFSIMNMQGQNSEFVRGMVCGIVHDRMVIYDNSSMLLSILMLMQILSEYNVDVTTGETL